MQVGIPGITAMDATLPGIMVTDGIRLGIMEVGICLIIMADGMAAIIPDAIIITVADITITAEFLTGKITTANTHAIQEVATVMT
jgi:hypothetical protein